MITETCLIGHGIPSVSNDELIERWPSSVPLGMILNGKIELLSMAEFVPFRGQALPRYNYFMLDNIPAGTYAFLTASGAMKAAELSGLRWALSGGLGGIHPELRKDTVCPDLYALGNSSVKLLAIAFKDMVDYEATFAQLRIQGSYYRFLDSFVPGYIFKLKSDLYVDMSPAGDCEGGLYLREIPAEKRIQDLELLSRGVAFGNEAVRAGKPFHPEVNGFFDRETDGYSSHIQFEALLSNIEYLLRNL
jgi:hypothetical protein